MSATVFLESSTELATLTNTFKVSGSPTDPSTVSLAVTPPSGTTTTYTYAGAQITKSGTGVYTKDVACSEAGDWVAVWTGTGTAADVVEVRWTVFGTVDRLYCSVESLKSRLGITDTNDDHELAGAVRAASEQINGYVGRPFGFGRDSAVTTRTFVADNGRSVRIPEGISTATGLIVKTDEAATGAFGTTLTVNTDFLLRPDNALADGWPADEIWLADNYSFPILSNGRHGVQITARFGWPQVPWAVREACLIASQALFKRKETSTGVVGFDGTGVVVRLAREDPDYAKLLAPYRIIAVG